ncbi:MAG: hypothetical protein HZA81_00980 [Candidatus Taylorbacteria bacterium]|nr:hypothetical protein [Candidatus Taylorbacteria bacterium]
MKKKRGNRHIALATAIALCIAFGIYLASRGGDDSSAKLPAVGDVGTAALADGAAKAASTYSDPSGFSFEVPTGYEPRAVEDGSGKMVLVEKQGEPGRGFQVFVSYYDEPASGFTAARIKKDIPDIVMKGVKEISIAGGKGVSFDSDSGREIWFVAGESLYQISAAPSEASHAETAFETFKIE